MSLYGTREAQGNWEQTYVEPNWASNVAEDRHVHFGYEGRVSSSLSMEMAS